jgi:hypothetical protein
MIYINATRRIWHACQWGRFPGHCAERLGHVTGKRSCTYTCGPLGVFSRVPAASLGALLVLNSPTGLRDCTLLALLQNVIILRRFQRYFIPPSPAGVQFYHHGCCGQRHSPIAANTFVS